MKENLESINNYINLICQEQSSTFNILQKVVRFLDKYNININMLSYIVTNNINLSNLIKKFISEHRDIIDNNKLVNLNFDDTLIMMIEFYCDINNIEIKDNIEYDKVSNINNPLDNYYKEIKKYPILNYQEEQEIFKKIRDGDKEAYDYFVKCNLRLVIKFIYKYFYNNNVDFWDLISEGNLGLMKAVELFNPSKGYKFSTYAKWWIENYIRRYCNKNSRLIILPADVLNKINRYINTKEKLEKELGYEVSFREIAKEMKIEEDEIIKIELLMQDTVKLDDYATDDEKTELINFIPSLDKAVEDEAINNIYIEEIKNIIEKSNFKDKEKKVLKLRYGLDDGIYRTLSETGNILHITKERVRQIEVNMLKKIKVNIKKQVSIPTNKLIQEDMSLKEEMVYRNLSKIGSRQDMEKVVKQLNFTELKLLYLVFGRKEIYDGSIPFDLETEFYKNLLPKIKRKYKLLTNEKITKEEIKEEYDKIEQIDILKVLSLLEKQVSKEFYNKLSYESKVILGFKLNDIGKKILDKSVAEYFGISEIFIKQLSINVLDEYKKYLEGKNTKKRIK